MPEGQAGALEDVVTDLMIKAGLRVLYRELGYSLELGDPAYGLSEAFKAMIQASQTEKASEAISIATSR